MEDKKRAKSLIESCSLLRKEEDWMTGVLVTHDSLRVIASLVQQNVLNNKHKSCFFSDYSEIITWVHNEF